MPFEIKIDRDACIGCGACVASCEELFELDDDGKAKAKKTVIEEISCAQDAADGCPVSCIEVNEK